MCVNPKSRLKGVTVYVGLASVMRVEATHVVRCRARRQLGYLFLYIYDVTPVRSERLVLADDGINIFVL